MGMTTLGEDAPERKENASTRLCMIGDMAVPTTWRAFDLHSTPAHKLQKNVLPAPLVLGFATGIVLAKGFVSRCDL